MTSDFGSAYTKYQLDRSFLRKRVRKLYLRRAATQLAGPTLDFGCGVGELLELLPKGSKGLEYNPVTVAHCRQRGLDVDSYDGFEDDWKLSVLPPDQKFRCMVISHVLEHLDDPIGIFCKLLNSARCHGVERVLVIVPGKAGFRIDPTHRVFVDQAMVADPAVAQRTGFKCVNTAYFPGDLRWIGDVFPHHELQAVFSLRTG